MSTLHKFKAYFGMVPLEDYEDDYLDDPASARRERDREREYSDPSYSGGYGPSHRDEYPPSRRDEPVHEFPQDDFDRYEAPPRPARVEPISARAPRAAAAPNRAPGRSSLAGESRLERTEARRGALFDEGGPLSKITTLRPRDYGEARTIGERFRDGTPVIMDLVEMSNADAKRLVDFAAGLAFALRGSFDKVATKVFLLSPADIDVSAEERRRIAETGFYSQQ